MTESYATPTTTGRRPQIQRPDAADHRPVPGPVDRGTRLVVAALLSGRHRASQPPESRSPA